MSASVTSIKHRLRNAGTRALSLSGVTLCYRTFFVPTPRVRVIAFHDVPDAEWFRSFVGELSRTTHLITPEEFRRGLFEAAPLNVLITFDDGYASWTEVALPVLEEHGVYALFFVSSALLDSAHDAEATEAFMRERLRIRPRASLSWDGVRALKESGHTIGAHGRTHADLTTLAAHALEDELERDKAAIEREIGSPVTHFAYPFGTKRHVNDAVRSAVEKAGYTFAYTARSGFVPRGERLLIPRTLIEDGLTPKALPDWLMGSYDILQMLMMR